MAYTTIDKPKLHFNTKLYSGNGGTQSITGVGFQPDLTWIKERNNAVSHQVFDVIRGATKRIYPDDPSAENTNAYSLTSFDTDGFSLGNAGSTNGSSDTYVSWNWKANGAGSANTDGTIASTVSANTTAGFSIVSWSGTGIAGTIGTGLNAVPKMIIVKSRTNGADWWGTYHYSLGNGKAVFLNDTAAEGTRTYWNNTTPTSSVFSVSNERSVNGSGETFIAYCFAPVTGFSAMGSYVGNGNSDGPVILTGHKPAMVIIKRTDNSSGANWLLLDSVRSDINVVNKNLFANLTDAETSTDRCNFLSNGFKLIQSGSTVNASGGTYIYLSFASASFVSSGNVPCTAF